MTKPTLFSLRKRPSTDGGARTDEISIYEAGSAKRQRTLSLKTASSSDHHPSIPGVGCSPTPPSSAAGTVTMALKLIIPQKQISSEQRRKLNRHKADSERWKPKLQRPYPRWTETKNAYPLKLMRHYPDATTRVPNFIRPNIDRSPRLSRLLQRFPLIETTQHVTGVPIEGKSGSGTPLNQAIPLSSRLKYLKEARSTHAELQMNIQVTTSEHAQRLAWQSFSVSEQDHHDRRREAMIQSGLLTDDLRSEALGQPNVLPDWRRPWTGRFAVEHQKAS